MATTLLSPSNDPPSPPSPVAPLQMPDVYVVPPEEDKTPTWCCFNASDAPFSTSPDIPSLDDTLSDIQAKSQALYMSQAALYDSAGPFGAHNTPIMQLSDSDHPPSAWMDDGPAEDVAEVTEPPPLIHKNTAKRYSSISNDSDVVEVVKVRRHADEREEYPRAQTQSRLKRSKSLKLRATQVLRSMKIVGKGSSRNKTADAPLPPLPLPPTPPTKEENFSRSKTPTLLRGKSAVLALFSGPATLGRSSISLAGATRNVDTASEGEPLPPLSPTEKALPALPRTSSTSASLKFRNPSLPSLSPHDIEVGRSPSPSFSLRTFSGKRRFSIMGLHRLFSFSDVTEASTDIPRPTTSLDSSGPPTVSSLGPETPIEEKTPLPYQLHLDLDTDRPEKSLDILRSESPPPQLEAGEISFEMRLDSLHFDDLSFDIDRF